MKDRDERAGKELRLSNHPTKAFDYLTEPDYKRPVYEAPEEALERFREKLEFLYGTDNLAETMQELQRILKVFAAHKPSELIEWERSFDPTERFSERDLILITYGDLVHARDEKPLHTLARMADEFGKDVITTIHILPFFPYTSDRGFSILDFETVDPALGTWDDIKALSKSYRLMFDGVVNHVSSKSRWFQEFLNGNPLFEEVFVNFADITPIPEHELALILRPRTSDLFTTYYGIKGPVRVWTTFSADQIDLNYKSERVLLKMVEILLFYVRMGADIIRLDAVTYLWEELGTRCANLPQTHAIVKLFRDVLDAVAPYVTLVTETNVPHEENIQYFGEGTDEAQMVYNFPLPPLVLHTFHTGDATALSDWAASLTKISDTVTYLNFLDSHDGIGLLGVRGLLPQQAIDDMCHRIVEHGGFISYRTDSAGMESPYEMNSTWFCAVNNVSADEELEIQVRRFVASIAICLALRGVPAFYLHGALGSLNDRESVLVSLVNRKINRHNIDADEFRPEAEDPDSRWSLIRRLRRPLLKARTSHKAFHPNGGQQILKINAGVFSLVRTSVDGQEQVICLTNVTAMEQSVALPTDITGKKGVILVDLATWRTYPVGDYGLEITLGPYDVIWLGTVPAE